MSVRTWQYMKASGLSKRVECVGLRVSNAKQLHLTNLIKALYHNGGTKMDCKSFVGIVARAELHRLVDIVVQLLPRDIAAGTRHANLNKEVWPDIRRCIIRLKITKIFGELRRWTRGEGNSKNNAQAPFHPSSMVPEPSRPSVHTSPPEESAQPSATFTTLECLKWEHLSFTKFVTRLAEADIDFSKHQVILSNDAGHTGQLQNNDTLASSGNHVWMSSFPTEPRLKILVTPKEMPQKPVDMTTLNDHQDSSPQINTRHCVKAQTYLHRLSLAYAYPLPLQRPRRRSQRLPDRRQCSLSMRHWHTTFRTTSPNQDGLLWETRMAGSSNGCCASARLGSWGLRVKPSSQTPRHDAESTMEVIQGASASGDRNKRDQCVQSSKQTLEIVAPCHQHCDT